MKRAGLWKRTKISRMERKSKGKDPAGEMQGETPEEAVTEMSEVQGHWETGGEQLPSRPRGGGGGGGGSC